jgi:hypothetical protein
MAFEDKDAPAPRTGIKQQAGTKSMFDNAKPRQNTAEQFQQKVQDVQERQSGYKKRAAELFLQFNKTMADKTLAQNRNLFNQETEKELLQNMVQLAIEINNDISENDGMGSLTWITCLFKTCLAQRDRINELDYEHALLKKRMETIPDFVKTEIARALDKAKSGG